MAILQSEPPRPSRVGPRRAPTARAKVSRSSVLLDLLVGLGYLLVAAIANWPAWAHGITHTIQTSGGSDVQEEVWFLAQTPWALVHGLNPLANNALNYPLGLNLMDNTTMPLLGIVGFPVTVLFGPIATFNVLIDVAFGASAFCFYVMAKRFVRWWPAAVIGGLLYGFSPFAIAVGTGHLFLLFAAIPPLVVLVVDRTLLRHTGSAWWGGIALGACLVAQFYVSTEAFSGMVVVGVIAAVCMVIAGIAGRIRIDRRRLRQFGVGAAVVALLGIGYGAWTAVAGPEHITGPAQTQVALAGLSTDPLSLVVPTAFDHFTFNHAALGDSLVAERNADWNVVFDAPMENGSYVGVPLLLVLVGGIVLLRRRRGVVLFAILAASAMVLSMGSYLHVDGHRTGIPLPFIALAHMPLLDSSIPSRYAEFFWLFAAILFAQVLDQVRGYLAGRLGPKGPWPTLSCLFLSAGSLVLLVPQWPYGTGQAFVPTWFTTTGSSLPVGSTVVVYPYAGPSNSDAMVWQAVARNTFRMPGGYAVFASPTGTASFAPEVTPLQSALAVCSGGQEASLSPAAVRAQLLGWHTRYVVVSPQATGARCAQAIFAGALGHPERQGRMLVWSVQS